LVIAVHDLIFGEFAVSILVNSLEDASKVFLLALGKELGCDEGESGLLKFLVSAETLQVGEGAHGHCRVYLLAAHLDDPRVLENLLSRWSLVNVIGKELGNHILSFI
jgi:hypothetical protein